MNKSRLEFGDSSIEVHHRGAHLCSWVCQGREQLFLSRKALLKTVAPADAMRGGVPICFPQFGTFGPGKKHGFARNVLWQKCESNQPNSLRFTLCHDQHSLALWPQEFKAWFDIELEGNSVSMRLHVENIGNTAMEFTAALHTYFALETIENAVIRNLQSCEFWDNGNAFSKRGHQQPRELIINKMIDRVYFNTLKPLSLVEPEVTRLIESQGFSDTVVWNPWLEGANALADMDHDEYQKMLCIESANVATPVCLSVGESWQGVQKVTVV